MTSEDEIPDAVVDAIFKNDWNKAFEILSELSKTGNANAEHFMGWFYEQGLEVKQSDTEAFNWWLKSAPKGIVESQSGLAQLYETGRGTEKNNLEAYYWYSQAILNGNTEAQICISNLSTKMNSAELNSARELLHNRTS